jgi:hypothetical protein
MSADRPSYGLSIFHGRARVESPPPGCREPSGLLPTRQWSPGTALTLWASWVPSPSGAEHHRSRRPCHPRAISSGHQRYPADNHGHFEKLDGLGSTALTWGGGGPRNCMACKGSRLGSALPCPAGRSVPGRGGPERRRRPRPDGTGTPSLLTACSRDHPTPAGTARDSYPWGRGESPSREACTGPDGHLGTALQRLITQRSAWQPRRLPGMAMRQSHRGPASPLAELGTISASHGGVSSVTANGESSRR